MSIAGRAKLWQGRLSATQLSFDWFAALHDLLSYQGHGLGAPSSPQVLGRIALKHDSDLRQALDDGLDLPAAVREEISAAIGLLSDHTRQLESLTELWGWIELLDSKFPGLNVSFSATGSLSTVRARERLLEAGTLSSSLELGWVGPKAMSGARGTQVTSRLTNLTRVDCEGTAIVDYHSLHLAGVAADIASIQVAVVPLVHDAAELSWEFSGDRYRVRVSDEAVTTLIDRVLKALDEIGNRAHVIVLPELVVCPRITESITAWLFGRPLGSLPNAVFCGTALIERSDGTVRNEGCIAVSEANVSLPQYKLNPYTLKADHRAHVTLPGADAMSDYVEQIDTTPHQITVIDVAGLGRLVMLICEDLSRMRPWRELLIGFGPNFCAVPIMNGDGWDWVHNAGIDIANETGTTLIVANSGTLLPARSEDKGLFVGCFSPLKRLGGRHVWTEVARSADRQDPSWLLMAGPKWPLRHGIDV
jgi:hypothetical protein